MAWRIADSVVRGEIDNRTRGEVCGRVWLLGRDEPVELQLQGNCHRDLAGCLLHFTNPQPKTGDMIDLHPVQKGFTGDLTASRKVRVLELPVEEAYERAKKGLPVPEHMGNSVYLEWFSEFNGRVVIESADFQVTVSEPLWTMSEEQFDDQRRANQEAMGGWMERLGEAVARHREENDDKSDDSAPADEFEWEKSFKESDALTDKYMALLEKYGDSPEAEKQIAREMGWEMIEEYLEAKEKDALPASDPSEVDDELPPREPNPATEGVDWMRDKHGHIHHPLQHRVFEVVMALWHECNDAGLLQDGGDDDLHQMLFQGQCIAAKLAGALNGIGYEDDVRDPGFIVAALKRSLPYLNESLARLDKVRDKQLVAPARLEQFRTDLHSIREGILALMQRFRNEQR